VHSINDTSRWETKVAVRLSLICSAPSAGVRPGTFPLDEPAEISEFDPDIGPIDRLVTAPERRAAQTAAAMGIPGIADIEPALREYDYGSWQGRTLEEIGAADPEGVAAWLIGPALTPHGGESLFALLDRVGTWLDRHEDQGHTVAVTHPAIIRAAIVHVLSAPAPAFWRIDIEPLSITDLRRHAGRWTLRSVGRV
jgi:broad specificity phosphatase PhoE